MVENIVILTGAGISAESGLATLRDKGGLWDRYDLREVATPEGFASNPGLVHDFYNGRRANCREALPNPAHDALARLEREHSGDVVIVTQNIDDLHERSGSRKVWHMHGEILKALCARCGSRWPAPPRMNADDPCPECGEPATRPDVVWFGEIPYFMEDIQAALDRCQLFVSVGTSGEVYPAAGFAVEAAMAGARTLHLNMERPSSPHSFHDVRVGPATEVVPRWVDEVLA